MDEAQRELLFYRCYRPAPAPADAQPIAMVEFRSGGGGDGQPEVILIFVKQSGGLGLLRIDDLKYYNTIKIHYELKFRSNKIVFNKG